MCKATGWNSTIDGPRPGVVAGARRALRTALLAAGALALAGCGMAPLRSDTPPETALAPQPTSPLVRIAQASVPAPGLTGFRLMPLGAYSLDARVALAQRATRSLDVQYYQISDDRTGRLVLRELRNAALRGVRVRLIVDDLYTSGGDPLFVGLAAFPNVEVRLFNPFCCARDSLLAKYAASLADFGRLNHRMHNKLFLADSALAVAGGRNIADEYFMRSMTDNFVDMDALMIGAVVPAARRHLRRVLEQPARVPGAGRDRARTWPRPRCARNSTRGSTRVRR